MSKEEALLFQKALISSKNREIKNLKTEIEILEKENKHLRRELSGNYKAEMSNPNSEIKIKRLAEIAKRNRLKRDRMLDYRK